MKISAVIITKNEEENIAACIRALSFCDEIILVDSGSADQTLSIARSLNAKIFTREFDNFASQKNFGISQAASEWVLLVDADERVTEELAQRILQSVELPGRDAYWVCRQNRLFGRIMRYGQNASDWQLRLVRKNMARFEGSVHERLAPPSACGRLSGQLLHDSTPTLRKYMAKLQHYTDLERDEMARRGTGESRPSLRRPLLLIIRRGILERGFLDGFEGLLFLILSGYYEFVRQAKKWESGQCLRN